MEIGGTLLTPSKKRKEIVRLKLQGRKNQEIAATLNLPVTEIRKTLNTVANRIRTHEDVLKLERELGLRPPQEKVLHVTKPVTPNHAPLV